MSSFVAQGSEKWNFGFFEKDGERERERVTQGRKAKVGGSVRKQNMAGEEEGERKGRKEERCEVNVKGERKRITVFWRGKDGLSVE